jgi:hypothetical protein
MIPGGRGIIAFDAHEKARQAHESMNPASTKEYRENRATFPPEELRKRAGQWAAFSGDGRRIVAGAASLAELAGQVRAAQEELQNVVLERIQMEPQEMHLGAAEWL